MSNYKKQTKVIGFDLDQTLYEKSPEIDEAIQKYIYKKIANHKKCSLEKAEKLFKDLYKEGGGLSGRRTLLALGVPGAAEIVQEALERADIAKFLVPNKETVNLLRHLKKNFKLDIITGSGKSTALSKLKKLGIPIEIFSHMITKDHSTKSDGVSYKLWLSFHPEFRAQDFLYIGDRPSDYLVPKKLGIEAILVNIKNKDSKLKCLQLASLLEIKKYLL